MRALGFTHRSPCAATLHTVFRRVDREAVEATLGAWAEGLLGEAPRTAGGEDAIAMDGKTLRGSQKQGAPGVHLLSAFAHRLGVTLAQQAVADKTNEIPVALELLRHLVLEGRIVTMDALLTQRQIAQQIVDAGGDYVMVVKANQPQLLEDIATVFALAPIAGERRTAAETLDLGHGRIEQRGLQTSNVLEGYSDWPGLAQVFRLERQVIVKKTGEVRAEVVAGVTSLTPERAEATRLLALYVAIGLLRIAPIGSGMSPLMKIARRSGVAISRRSWLPCATRLLGSCAGPDIPTWRRPAAVSRPSRRRPCI